MSQVSVTKFPQQCYIRYNGQVLHVVDCPGLSDSNQVRRHTTKAIEQAMLMKPDGYDVIIYVCELGRFTQEDAQVVKMLRVIFGTDMFENHCIIAMTHADDYDDEQNDGKTIDEWVNEQEGEFGEVCRGCFGRVVALDNITDDESVKKQQIEKILELTKKIVAENGRYTKEKFDMGQEDRCRYIYQVYDRDFLEEIDKLQLEISTINIDNSNNVLQELESKMKQVAQLKDVIVKQDIENSDQKTLIANCNYLLEIIANKIECTNKLIKQAEMFKEERREYQEKLTELSEKRDQGKQIAAMQPKKYFNCVLS